VSASFSAHLPLTPLSNAALAAVAYSIYTKSPPPAILRSPPPAALSTAPSKAEEASEHVRNLERRLMREVEKREEENRRGKEEAEEEMRQRKAREEDEQRNILEEKSSAQVTVQQIPSESLPSIASNLKLERKSSLAKKDKGKRSSISSVAVSSASSSDRNVLLVLPAQKGEDSSMDEKVMSHDNDKHKDKAKEEEKKVKRKKSVQLNTSRGSRSSRGAPPPSSLLPVLVGIPVSPSTLLIGLPLPPPSSSSSSSISSASSTALLSSLHSLLSSPNVAQHLTKLFASTALSATQKSLLAQQIAKMKSQQKDKEKKEPHGKKKKRTNDKNNEEDKDKDEEKQRKDNEQMEKTTTLEPTVEKSEDKTKQEQSPSLPPENEVAFSSTPDADEDGAGAALASAARASQTWSDSLAAVSVKDSFTIGEDGHMKEEQQQKKREEMERQRKKLVRHKEEKDKQEEKEKREAESMEAEMQSLKNLDLASVLHPTKSLLANDSVILAATAPSPPPPQPSEASSFVTATTPASSLFAVEDGSSSLSATDSARAEALSALSLHLTERAEEKYALQQRLAEQQRVSLQSDAERRRKIEHEIDDKRREEQLQMEQVFAEVEKRKAEEADMERRKAQKEKQEEEEERQRLEKEAAQKAQREAEERQARHQQLKTEKEEKQKAERARELEREREQHLKAEQEELERKAKVETEKKKEAEEAEKEKERQRIEEQETVKAKARIEEEERKTTEEKERETEEKKKQKEIEEEQAKKKTPPEQAGNLHAERKKSVAFDAPIPVLTQAESIISTPPTTAAAGDVGSVSEPPAAAGLPSASTYSPSSTSSSSSSAPQPVAAASSPAAQIATPSAVDAVDAGPYSKAFGANPKEKRKRQKKASVSFLESEKVTEDSVKKDSAQAENKNAEQKQERTSKEKENEKDKENDNTKEKQVKKDGAAESKPALPRTRSNSKSGISTDSSDPAVSTANPPEVSRKMRPSLSLRSTSETKLPLPSVTANSVASGDVKDAVVSASAVAPRRPMLQGRSKSMRRVSVSQTLYFSVFLPELELEANSNASATAAEDIPNGQRLELTLGLYSFVLFDEGRHVDAPDIVDRRQEAVDNFHAAQSRGNPFLAHSLEALKACDAKTMNQIFQVYAAAGEDEDDKKKEKFIFHNGATILCLAFHLLERLLAEVRRNLLAANVHLQQKKKRVFSEAEISELVEKEKPFLFPDYQLAKQQPGKAEKKALYKMGKTLFEVCDMNKDKKLSEQEFTIRWNVFARQFLNVTAQSNPNSCNVM
jgi:hypothetical protein